MKFALNSKEEGNGSLKTEKGDVLWARGRKSFFQKGVIMKILNKGIEWSILTGCCVVILLITVVIILSLVFPRFERVQKQIDKINGVTRENLTGIRVIRAFNAENFQRDRFEKENNDLKNDLFNSNISVFDRV